MRGMYTAGVLDTFLEHNVTMDAVVGVSAGALFGVNYLSKQVGRVIRYNKRFNGDKNYIGLKPLLKEGNIVSTKYAYEDVPRKLDPFDNAAFMQSKTPFYAVVTNMKNGQAEYIQIKDAFAQMDTLRASGSMPFVSKPVTIGGAEYLDGGIADSIPYEWLLQQGYDKVVVILTRDMSYRKKPMSKLPIDLWYHNRPGIAKQLLKRHEVYNRAVEKLAQLEKDGTAFVIRPSEPITLGKIESDPDKLQGVYDLGRADAMAQMTALQRFLEKNKA